MTINLADYGIDTASLESGIGAVVVSELASVLGAEQEDLREFGLSVARHGVAAFLAGDKGWSAEVRAQVKGLLELVRIRVEVVDWDLVEKVAAIAVKAALSGAASLIPGASALPGLGGVVSGLLGRSS